MSVLLIGLEHSPGEEIASLLIEEGDEVRVLIDRQDDAARWKRMGAHVAVGPMDDADLIERAAQFCRSIVAPATAALDAVTSGMQGAGVDRLVLLASTVKQAEEAKASIDGVDHVILVTRRRGLLGKAIPGGDLAVAVSAADDLAGHQKVVADLGDPRGWEALQLEAR